MERGPCGPPTALHPGPYLHHSGPHCTWGPNPTHPPFRSIPWYIAAASSHKEPLHYATGWLCRGPAPCAVRPAMVQAGARPRVQCSRGPAVPPLHLYHSAVPNVSHRVPNVSHGPFVSARCTWVLGTQPPLSRTAARLRAPHL